MIGTCDPLKMFSFSVMQPSLCFSNVGILAIDDRMPRSVLLHPIITVPKKETILVLPYLGVQSKLLPNSLRPAIINFMAALILG